MAFGLATVAQSIVKADTLDLTKLFANAVRYLVPIFQRPYVWRQDTHWEPLWEDVRVVSEAVVVREQLAANGGGVPDVAPHFLGAIVLDQVLNPTGSIEARYVIDGQQRLTTLQLFLSAAREVAVDLEQTKCAQTIGGLILNPEYLVDEAQDHRFKVWPTLRDRAAFAEVITAHGELDANVDHAGHRMAYAETFFRKEISAWIADDDSGPEGCATPEVRQARMKALTSVIGRMLKLVVIDLESNDNAQVIFETLNARGTPLLASDLVKNLVFQRADTDDAGLQALYDNYWAPFDTDHWLASLRQGRLNRPRIEVFLFHWLTMQTEREVAATRLFQAFKTLLDTTARPVDEVLAEFARDGKVFDSFDEHPAGSREERFFKRLAAIDTATVIPVVLWLFRQPSDVLAEHRRVRALEALESWLIRRMVCHLTTKNYNRFFLDLLGTLKASPGEADQVLIQRLRAEEVVSQYWPGDADFAKALSKQPLYGSLSQKRVRTLLLALENRFRDDARLGETIPAGTKFQIEHVLPQSWQEYWPLPADAAPDAADEREAAKQSSRQPHPRHRQAQHSDVEWAVAR